MIVVYNTSDLNNKRARSFRYNGYDGVLTATSLGSDGCIYARSYFPVISEMGILERVEPLSRSHEECLKLPLEDGLINCLRAILENKKRENGKN